MNQVIRGKVSGMGRIVLPAELRRELGITDGDDLLFSRMPHGIQVTTLDHAVRQAQETVARYIPEAVNLVDELRQHRQKDATLV
jgi:AbrB family looped-hinge helix DNA binding protein